MNLDDCWQSSERDAHGKVQAESSRFPSGLPALSEYIHSKNLKFGIYSSAGFKTCQGFPASLGMEAIDAQSYADWGVDYLKYDNCYKDHGIPQNRYKQMAEALQQTGREVFYSLCEWGRENPAAWASGIGAQSWRISLDIRDSWHSIMSRAETAASLWRFAGPGRGWNDPDMLEIGNGQCSEDEYRTHFALWAMLKAPLIIGNDIRMLTADSPILAILSNKEIIAVNQDSLGVQGRIVWSDTMDLLRSKFDFGERLIATKCASGAIGAIEDSAENQQWAYNAADGTIRSASTNQCLRELSPLSMALDERLAEASSHFNWTVGLRTVTTVDCSAPDVTHWDVTQGVGGSIVSRETGLCLEVTKMEYLPAIQGKRIQTASCQKTDIQDKSYWDIREHQSWTQPHGQLLNLYQRQCLTVDRDAFPGITAEVWMTSLSQNKFAVLAINKGPLPQRIEISLDMLSLPQQQAYQMRDLWKHEDLTIPLSSGRAQPFVLKSHESAMILLTPVR